MYVVGARLKEPADLKKTLEKIESYRKENGVFLQLFDHSKVIGAEHLEWAHQKAEETFEQKSNRADDPEIETLLWASAEWQIQDALDKMGIDDGAKKIAVMIDSDAGPFLDFMGWTRDDSVLEPSVKKLKEFGIGEDEIGSVDSPYDLVFEKMATAII